MDDIARQLNPLLRGWIAYYGKYAPSALEPLYRHVNRALMTWARRKFKRFGGSRMRVMRFLDKLSKANPDLPASSDLAPGASGPRASQ